MNINENLKGRTILIGKEPAQGRLSVCVELNGSFKQTAIGAVGSLPQSVSRCKAAEGIAHCRLDIDGNGNITVTNMKSQNVTYVNGLQIISKHLKDGATLELGQDRYAVNLQQVLDAAAKIVAVTVPPKPKEFSITHLEAVWERYHSGNIALKKRSQEMAAAQSFPPILTLGGGAITAVAGMAGFFQVTFITVPLTLWGLGLMVRNYFRRKNDTSVDDGERLVEELQRNYVCPNPDCRHYLGMQPYNILRQSKKCPYCGAIFKS